jgi:hypothetical protein
MRLACHSVIPAHAGIHAHHNVIPAKAGIQCRREVDSRVRGNDSVAGAWIPASAGMTAWVARPAH